MPLDKFVIACFALVNYLAKLLFPLGLSSFYPYPLKIEGLLPYPYYAAAFVCLVLPFFIFVIFRRNRNVLFGILFFIFNIFIVLGFVPVGNYFMAERYTYIPYIGLFFIMASALEARRPAGKLIWALIIVFLVFCAGDSNNQILGREFT